MGRSKKMSLVEILSVGVGGEEPMERQGDRICDAEDQLFFCSRLVFCCEILFSVQSRYEVPPKGAPTMIRPA
jgi:hypothetical protein